MRSVFTLLKIEGKISLRCPDGILFGIGMPIGVLFLIAFIGGDAIAGDTTYTFLQGAFASLLTVGICATGFMGLPLNVADYRDKKILKHFFVTPASPMKLLFVQVCICMLIAVISAAAVALISILCFDYRMQGNVVRFIGAYFLVMLSMYSIGMVIASLCRTVKVANLVTTFVYFPMLFLSGATIPYELFPKGVQQIANILPLTHGIKLLKNISLGTANNSAMTSVIVLVVITVICCVISAITFKWE